MDKKVAVIMGSDSDLPVVKGAINSLKLYEIPVEVHVMSAHRTPEIACEFLQKKHERMDLGSLLQQQEWQHILREYLRRIRRYL